MILEVPTPADPECPIFALLGIASCEECLEKVNRIFCMDFPDGCLRWEGKK